MAISVSVSLVTATISVAVVLSGISIGGSATVENSDDTYSETVEVGEKHELPDIIHTDSDGSPSTKPAQTAFVCSTCEDATVENSDDSYSETVASGAKHELPDVNHIDSDGSSVATPGQKVFVCTLADLQTEIDDATANDLSDALEANTDVDKIAYRRAPLTGQTASYRTGDDGWRLQNGIYQYDKQGKRPMLQGEDSDNADGTQDDWLMLSPKTPNKYGTLYRLTDSVGGQNFDGTGGSIADYMEEHVGGYGWQFNSSFGVFGTLGWNGSTDASVAHDNGTYSNFFLPTPLELLTIFNFGAGTSLINYVPITLTATKYLWTCTTYPFGTTRSYNFATSGTTMANCPGKTSSQHSIYIRNI